MALSHTQKAPAVGSLNYPSINWRKLFNYEAFNKR